MWGGRASARQTSSPPAVLVVALVALVLGQDDEQAHKDAKEVDKQPVFKKKNARREQSRGVTLT